MKKLLLIICAFSTYTFAENKLDHKPECKDEYGYAYFIYQEAMRNAKEGKCDLSFKQFKETEKQWRYILTAPHCSKKEQEDAESNISRVSFDIGVLKKRYCPNVGS